MKRTGNSILIIILLFLCVPLFSQVPDGYYTSANGKYGAPLKTALYHIIKDPEVVSYALLWEMFEKTDSQGDNNVWDMYSDRPTKEAMYYHDFRRSRCGSYRKEGDCYNREHTLPRSWFQKNRLLESDLFHLYPADGFVNNRRGNLPFGEVGIILWESTNGSKVGQNTFGDYTKMVFEPIDEYKGDFARTFFYLVTAYENEVVRWNSDQVGNSNYPGLSDWSLHMLLKWHREDPVSIKEVRRNEEVYKIQGNRNPFIDYPHLVEHVWGDAKEMAFDPEECYDSFMLIECSPFERWLDQMRGYINKYTR